MLLALHATPALVQRFTNEARAVNAIRHPNIPQVIDHGLFPDGVPWMVMEYIDGESLEARLKRERLNLVEVLAIADDVASAIAAAHHKNIIHRDLKYSNVMLVPDDTKLHGIRAMVLDFGIAKLVDEQGVTSTGSLVGTPVFMAYEQIVRPKDVDGKADVYSLGLMLFQMLCQRLPFPWTQEDSTLLVLSQKVNPPTPIEQYAPELPDELRALINAMLQKDREQRPTMADVRLVVRRVQGLPPPRQTGGYDPLRVLPAPVQLVPGTLDLRPVPAAEYDPTVDAPLIPFALPPPAVNPGEQPGPGELPPSPIPVAVSLSDSHTAKVESAPRRAGPEESTVRPAPAQPSSEAVVPPPSLAVPANAAPAVANRIAPSVPAPPFPPRILYGIAGALLLGVCLAAGMILSSKPPPPSATLVPDLAERRQQDAQGAESPDMAVSADLGPATEAVAKNEVTGKAGHSRGKEHSGSSGCAIPKLSCITGRGVEAQLRLSIAEAFAEAKVGLCAGERILLELEPGSRDPVLVDAPTRLDKEDRKILGAALRSRLTAPDRRISVDVRCKR